MLLYFFKRAKNGAFSKVSTETTNCNKSSSVSVVLSPRHVSKKLSKSSGSNKNKNKTKKPTK